jgi:hypothetical protein
MEQQEESEAGLPATTAETPSISEYFEGRTEKPSARVYNNLASDPMMAEVVRRKRLSYREMTLVVSSVVGALDERIEELEARDGTWRRLRGALNAPLIAHSQNPGDARRELED